MLGTDPGIFTRYASPHALSRSKLRQLREERERVNLFPLQRTHRSPLPANRCLANISTKTSQLTSIGLSHGTIEQQQLSGRRGDFCLASPEVSALDALQYRPEKVDHVYERTVQNPPRSVTLRPLSTPCSPEGVCSFSPLAKYASWVGLMAYRMLRWCSTPGSRSVFGSFDGLRTLFFPARTSRTLTSSPWRIGNHCLVETTIPLAWRS